MAEVKVQIGGREFEVACRDGEEHFLISAAAMLDNEASALTEALGRMPETRMLLMAGLMLADKTASLEDKVKQAGGAPISDDAARKRVQKAETQLSNAQTSLAEAKAQLAETQAKVTKVASARDEAIETMRRMVEKVEKMAEKQKKAG